jgi:hypothetical protein
LCARPLSDFAERCIAVSPLHLGHDAVNDAIAEMRQRRQMFGNVFQERIAILHGERLRGSKDGVHLAIGQLEHLRFASNKSRSASSALATAAIARNILDGKKLPHDPDLVAIVADRLQGYLRERAKRGDVIKAGKRRDAQWALAPALV